MACNPLDPGSCVGELVQDSLQAMAQGFADSASWAVKNLTSVWLGTPSPDVGDGSVAAWLGDRVAVFVLAAAFLSILWCAYRLATSGTFDHLAELGYALARLVLVAGCAAAATTAALAIGDAVAKWVMAGTELRLSAVVVGGVARSPALVILLSVVVILAQVVQVVLMLVKNAMVVLLVGFLPLTAAATNTPVGRGGFHKALTWLVAFLLYKPVAAIIYAVSFKLSSRDQGISAQLSGLALMVLAIVALPALMRFLVPVTAAATGGNSGAIAGAVVGATVATGATLAVGSATGGAGFAAAPALQAAMQAGPTGAAMGAAPAASGAVSPSDERSPA